MSKHAHGASYDLGTLVEQARALIAATADVAEGTVADARKRLTATLESAQDIAGQVRDKAADCAKATDEAVHEHPYRAMGIAFGAGAIFSYLVTRRCSRAGFYLPIILNAKKMTMAPKRPPPPRR